MCVHCDNSPCAICNGLLLPNMAVVVEDGPKYPIGFVCDYDAISMTYEIKVCKPRPMRVMRHIKVPPEKIILVVSGLK